VLTIVIGLAVAALVFGTEQSLATRLGTDYARFPRLDGGGIRRLGEHIYGVFRGFLALIGVIFVVGVAFQSPALIFIVAAILQLRAISRRRASWSRVHEQERRQILGSEA
jgi:hypothetical protein